MRKYALFAMYLSSLTGCATEPAQFGNFVENSSGIYARKIADDAVKQLITLYPPAQTRFVLQHDTPDEFGIYLLTTLRAKGYAIQEKEPDDTSKKSAPSSPGITANGYAMSYILDQVTEFDMYRVSLIINHQSLDRAYQLHDGQIHPASYWVRKE